MQTEKMVLDTDPKRGVVERFSLQETPQRCGCRDNLDSPLWKTSQMGLFRPHLSVYLDGYACFGGVRESTFWLQRILVRPNSEETPTQHSGKTGTTNHGASRLKPWTCPVPTGLDDRPHGSDDGGEEALLLAAQIFQKI